MNLSIFLSGRKQLSFIEIDTEKLHMEWSTLKGMISVHGCAGWTRSEYVTKANTTAHCFFLTQVELLARYSSVHLDKCLTMCNGTLGTCYINLPCGYTDTISQNTKLKQNITQKHHIWLRFNFRLSSLWQCLLSLKWTKLSFANIKEWNYPLHT